MAIGHNDDHAAPPSRLHDLHVRTVIDADPHGYRILQLHPQDTGGSFLEIDFQPGGEDPSGPWMPAGPAGRGFRRTDVVPSITGVTVSTRTPSKTARTWSDITACPLATDVDPPRLLL